MNTKTMISRSRDIANKFRVSKGKNFRLKDVDPGDTMGLNSEEKPRAKEALALGIHALAELQDVLWMSENTTVSKGGTYP